MKKKRNKNSHPNKNSKRDWENKRYYIGVYFSEAWQLIRRNRFLSIFTGLTIFVLLTMSYTLIALNTHLNQALSQANDNVLVTAVLSKNADQEELIKQVEEVNGVSKVTFVSQEETMKRFVANTKFPEGSIPDVSIFPRVLEIQTQNTNILPEVNKQVAAITGIDRVDYLADLIKTITNTTDSLRKIALFVVFFFAALAIGLLIAVVRVSVHSKKENVEIMTLVGAPKTTILIPLLLQVLIITVIAGTLACLVGYFIDPNLGVSSGSFLTGDSQDLPAWLATDRAFGFFTLWPILVPSFCLIASLITYYSVSRYIKRTD